MQDWIDAHLHHDGAAQPLPVIDHAFTHFDLRLQPTLLTAATRLATVADTAGLCWYDPKSPARIGLAKPVLDILKALSS
jgi:A/G-specific adenine glycosylase